MEIRRNIDELRDRVNRACLRCGRDAGEVRIMAVSKFHGVEAMAEAFDAGIRVFGESRVQEAAKKIPAFIRGEGLIPRRIADSRSAAGLLIEGRREAEVHMIGGLQRNKARIAAGIFHCVQSVDRVELIEELAKHSAGRDAPLELLLELHTGEESKAGFPDVDSLSLGAEAIMRYPSLAIRGLMTMAPYTGDEKLVRSSFRTLAAAREKLKSRFGESCWTVLSMGMSGDFEAAIEEGSTMIRVGTLIFGERP